MIEILDSSHDFGKDVIPLILEEKKKLFAYPFKGYWKDVGTVKSLWEANMDLLNDECELNLFDYDWRIYSVNPNQPPQYISPDAIVRIRLLMRDVRLKGKLKNLFFFKGLRVGKGSIIKGICDYARCGDW